MIKRLKQVYSKFLFCLHIAAGPRDWIRLILNSKRFNQFHKKQAVSTSQKQTTPARYKIRYKTNKRNLYLRTYAGDIQMFYEIFWEQVYRWPPSFPEINGTIIDAGANVGMAALYFSGHFPNTKIYCIEPSIENFRVLKMNLAQELESGRIQALQAALHERNGITHIHDKGWAYNVSVDDAGEESVTAITVQTFLERYHIGKVDLLKMDIEGAEEFIFFSETDWLKKVNAILIEIHSPELIERIKAVLLNAGFHWYKWQNTEVAGSLYFASKEKISTGKMKETMLS
jgi:FkbM family methyltransferase